MSSLNLTSLPPSLGSLDHGKLTPPPLSLSLSLSLLALLPSLLGLTRVEQVYKFLVDREGRVVKRYIHRVTPLDLEQDILDLLG